MQPDTPTINARTELLIKSTLSNVFDSPVRSSNGPRDFRGYGNFVFLIKFHIKYYISNGILNKKSILVFPDFD